MNLSFDPDIGTHVCSSISFFASLLALIHVHYLPPQAQSTAYNTVVKHMCIMQVNFTALLPLLPDSVWFRFW